MVLLRQVGRVAVVLMLGLGVVSCDVETMLRRVIIKFYETEPGPPPADVVAIVPIAETEPVLDDTDAADDPAIWIDPVDASGSRVIGTNKRRGVEVYDLRGKRLWRLDAGRINNVDLRAGVLISGERKVVVAGTNRTSISIDVWALTPDTGELASVLEAPIPAELDDPYGFCLYQRAADGALFAFATGKEGDAVQWRLRDTGQGLLRGERVRRITVESQSEGCVVDDANGSLFIGEEAVGIWRLNADPQDGGEERTLVASTRPSAEAEAPRLDSPHRITADVEGLAIYAPPDAGADAGYLLASSQGNWTYVVFDRAPPHAYRGTFQVVDGGGIDGAGETDGLEVASLPVGADYPQGLVVVQDGYNVDASGGHAHQNFKYLSWADVAAELGL